MEDYSELIQVLISALVSVLVVAVPILAKAARDYLKTLDAKVGAEIGEAQWESIKAWTEIFIRAAEQKVIPETTGISDRSVLNELRKDFVLGHVHQKVDELGLPIDDAQIDALIEGIFKRLKDEEIILLQPAVTVEG